MSIHHCMRSPCPVCLGETTYGKTFLHPSRWPADWDQPDDAPGLAELVGQPSQINLDTGLSDVEEQHPENIELGEN